jgi:hypothetical protein
MGYLLLARGDNVQHNNLQNCNWSRNYSQTINWNGGCPHLLEGMAHGHRGRRSTCEVLEIKQILRTQEYNITCNKTTIMELADLF